MHEDASRARPRGPAIGEPRVPSLTMLDGGRLLHVVQSGSVTPLGHDG
jgi:hypothetical protein